MARREGSGGDAVSAGKDEGGLIGDAAAGAPDGLGAPVPAVPRLCASASGRGALRDAAGRCRIPSAGRSIVTSTPATIPETNKVMMTRMAPALNARTARAAGNDPLSDATSRAAGTLSFKAGLPEPLPAPNLGSGF